MNLLNQVRQRIDDNPEYWSLHLMDFVDDFRRHQNIEALSTPFKLTHNRLDAVFASTAEALCDEANLAPPQWLIDVPGCREPWFVAGMESLKAIALAESPLRFRIRKIFVLENFLTRV